MSKWKGRESKENKLKRLGEVTRLLKKYYPDAHCALNFENPLQLLIATILSAQCTDERVNIVTEKLFVKYPDVHAYANAEVEELEKDIHSTGFYKNKAKNIKSCCQTLVKKHDGIVPKDLNQLVDLAGVGRKTANVVLGNAFNIASGVVVDTHVTRLSNRLGFVKGKNAEILERELGVLVPQKNWIMFPHWLISHGRKVCKARKPQCHVCFLDDDCPKRGV